MLNFLKLYPIDALGRRWHVGWLWVLLFPVSLIYMRMSNGWLWRYTPRCLLGPAWRKS